MINQQMPFIQTQFPFDKSETKKTPCWIFGLTLAIIGGGVAIYFINKQINKNVSNPK